MDWIRRQIGPSTSTPATKAPPPASDVPVADRLRTQIRAIGFKIQQKQSAYDEAGKELETHRTAFRVAQTKNNKDRAEKQAKEALHQQQEAQKAIETLKQERRQLESQLELLDKAQSNVAKAQTIRDGAAELQAHTDTMEQMDVRGAAVDMRRAASQVNRDSEMLRTAIPLDEPTADNDVDAQWAALVAAQSDTPETTDVIPHVDPERAEVPTRRMATEPK